ncbi:acyl-CoA dehydrogenase [Thermoplasma volcanium GSS1]|uniref:Acyl-CoA dehydrogenase n=2 Tax=Thermoplasma volcanium TaxID=50339 RepID=Q978P8_THEVO|nr:acyl-CoA dehydrogenase [Thermoplasma volcanium GSS1]
MSQQKIEVIKMLCLSEEQSIIKGSIAEFTKRRIEPIEKRIEDDDYFPMDILREIGKNGFFSVMLPGIGVQDTYSFSLIAEEISKVSPEVAWLYVTHVAASYALDKLGTEEQKDSYLRKMADGEIIGTIAITESSSGATASAIASSARKYEENWILEGSKTFITMGGDADLYAVLAKTHEDPAAFTTFIVLKSDVGLELGTHLIGSAMKGIGWGEISFNNLILEKHRILGKENEGIKIIPTIARIFSIGAASISLGIMERALELVSSHVKERKIACKSLLSNQTVQDKLFHLYADTEAARSLVYRASINDDIRLAYSAKLFSTERSIAVTESAVSLFGATGYEESLAIPKLLNKAIAVPLHFINNAILTGLFITAID